MINSSRTKNDFIGKDLQMQFYHARTAFCLRAALRSETAANAHEAVLPEVNHIQKLLSNRLLNRLPDHTFARLLVHLEPVVLRAGEILHKPAEDSRFVYFAEDAVISHLHILTSGNTVETALIGSEGVVGLHAVIGSAQPTHWAEVTIGGSALKIKTEIIRNEFKNCSLLQALLLDYASRHIEQVSQKAVCHIHHLAEERLCNWLLMLQERSANELLPLTHDQIARYLGVHRPSITHVAMSLRKRNLIEYVRGYVKIVDRPRLEKVACECYAPGKENQPVINCLQTQ